MSSALMTRVWIALGSNLGDRRGTLAGAVEALRATPGIAVRLVSPILETAPVGGPAGQGPYLNGVLVAETELTARALLGVLQAVEVRYGRDRTREPRNGPRTLDLDLLSFGTQRIREPDLVVPHPRMEERVFVLEPMARLAPEERLASGRTVSERLRELLEGRA